MHDADHLIKAALEAISYNEKVQIRKEVRLLKAKKALAWINERISYYKGLMKDRDCYAIAKTCYSECIKLRGDIETKISEANQIYKKVKSK